MSFDPATGDLGTADTGQNHVEEVDVVDRGGNCGWNMKEGTCLFHPGSPDDPEDSGVTEGDVQGVVDPVGECSHTRPAPCQAGPGSWPR
jgi:hypothetical protein